MNKVIISGRTTKEIELRYTPGNQMAVTSFTLAVDRGKDKNGNDKGADFPRCIAFGRTAETAEKWLRKGARVAIEGHIQTGSYDGRNGEKVYTTDVVVDRMEIIDWPAKDAQSGNQSVTRPQESAPDGYAEIAEDVPF